MLLRCQKLNLKTVGRKQLWLPKRGTLLPKLQQAKLRLLRSESKAPPTADPDQRCRLQRTTWHTVSWVQLEVWEFELGRWNSCGWTRAKHSMVQESRQSETMINDSPPFCFLSYPPAIYSCPSSQSNAAVQASAITFLLCSNLPRASKANQHPPKGLHSPMRFPLPLLSSLPPCFPYSTCYRWVSWSAWTIFPQREVWARDKM